MNHRTLTIAATIGLLAFTSCSAQQRQIVENLTNDPTPAEVMVDAPAAEVLAEPAAVGSNPPITECGLPGEVFTSTPWPQCIPDPCLTGERWVEDHCIID